MHSQRKSCHDFADAELESMGVMPIEQCGFSHLEMLVLRLLRHFCMTHAQPSGQSWRLALQDAVFHLGAEHGPKLALSASDYLDALRSERSKPFNFVDPQCPHCSRRIFPAEWAMMTVLRALRGGEPMHVDTALAIVLQTDCGATRRAARALAEVMNRLDSDPPEHAETVDRAPTLH